MRGDHKIEVVRCCICKKEFIRWNKYSQNRRKPKTIVARPCNAVTCSKACSSIRINLKNYGRL